MSFQYPNEKFVSLFEEIELSYHEATTFLIKRIFSVDKRPMEAE